MDIAKSKSINEAEGSQPLLSGGSNAMAEAALVKRSFLTMCVSMACCMGTVTTVIAFAGADFPATAKFSNVGTLSTGILFGAYCLSALFLAPLILAVFGKKMCLVAGVSQYCVYLGVYVLAELVLGVGTETTETPDRSIYAILIGSFIGGLGSGYLWPAQGAYFAASAKKYAELTGQPEQDITGKFSSYFASCFLFCEIAFKFIGAGIKQGAGEVGTKAMYVTFLCIGIAAAFAMTLIRKVEDPGPRPPVTFALVTQKSAAAMKLLGDDPKMSLMLPFEFAFGVSAAFLNGYIAPSVTKVVFNKQQFLIGYFAGIVAFVACLVSLFGGWYIEKYKQKSPLMVTGCLAFVAMAAPFLAINKPEEWSSSEASSYLKLAALYAAQGVGRGVFESTNKAVIADFFSASAPAAFANVIWSSGGSTALGYILFPSITGKQQAGVVTGLALAGLVCYLIAARIHSHKKQNQVEL